ncbi:MAG: amidohydrolase [SAR324 cluster bacterium]|nr:amidohydrolase [SAR324 cluster bacterium]
MIKKNNLLAEIHKESITWRKILHQHPQTCYEEEFASNFIINKLTDFGIDYESNIAKTGVVGRLKAGNSTKKKIALRADIDALNITEENSFSYKSKFAGKMHACGHDGHTSMLLAAAKYLSLQKNFSGEVYFIFQPAEEGGAGADKMMKEGLFDKYPAQSVWGMHNTPGVAVGTINLMSGTMMASADMFEIKVIGSGGHAAKPHVTVDPILVASHIVTALQSIISRNIAPTDSGVITVSKVKAGTAFNIIPDIAILSGTVRALDENTRLTLLNRIEKIANSIAQAFEARIEFSLLPVRYPTLVNTKKETDIAELVAKKTVKEVSRNMAPSLGGEDFAFMLQKKPGCYIFLGNGKFGEKGGNDLHTAKYDFNDNSSLHGIGYWVNLVEHILKP